jgi:acyl dehydratase
MTVAVGTELPPFAVSSVPSTSMKTIAALLHDSNAIHWDRDALRELGMDSRLVNQGTSNLAYIVNMITAWAERPGALTRLRVRFLGNVLEGDSVVARGVVSGLREASDGVTAELQVWLERSGARVLEGVAEVRLGRDVVEREGRARSPYRHPIDCSGADSR